MYSIYAIYAVTQYVLHVCLLTSIKLIFRFSSFLKYVQYIYNIYMLCIYASFYITGTYMQDAFEYSYSIIIQIGLLGWVHEHSDGADGGVL